MTACWISGMIMKESLELWTNSQTRRSSLTIATIRSSFDRKGTAPPLSWTHLRSYHTTMMWCNILDCNSRRKLKGEELASSGILDRHSALLNWKHGTHPRNATLYVQMYRRLRCETKARVTVDHQEGPDYDTAFVHTWNDVNLQHSAYSKPL